MSLREATVVLREGYQEKRDFNSEVSQRAHLMKELTDLTQQVSSLQFKRDQAKAKLNRYCEEEGTMKKRLRQCSDIVEKTVGSIDEIFTAAAAHANPGGEGEERDSQRTIRNLRRKAEAAEAEASALLARLAPPGLESPER